jgi:hypothetical protein
MNRNHKDHSVMFKKAMTTILLALCLGSLEVFAAVEEDPVSMGSSGALTLTNGSFDPAANPAILGLPLAPRGGVIFTPILPSVRAGYFSDVLALTPYKDLWKGDHNDDFWRTYINTLINKSFNVEGMSPSATSKRIARRVEDGIGIYEGVNVNIFSLRLPRLLVDITTTVDGEERVSGVPFLILFSDTKGIVKGNTFDLSDTRADAIACTRIGVHYAVPFTLPRLFDRIGSWTKGKITFDQCAVGAGVKYVLGHSMMRLRVPESAIAVAPDGENISYKARAVITEAGTGLDENFSFSYVPGNTFIAGNGFGIDGGFAMSGAKGPKLGVAMHDLGFIAWRDAQERAFYVKCDSVQMNVLNVNKGDSTDTSRVVDTMTDSMRLNDVGTRYTMLPLRFSLSASYEWDMAARFGSSISALSKFTRVGFIYEQHVTRWPGRSRIPKLAIGGENGFLYGVVPFRAGLIFGGAERSASTLGFGIDARVIKLDVAYKANGSLYFYPRRGVELALRIATVWGTSSDNDRDKISGTRDKCPQEPEDKDGFCDDDGCPDPDNDNDGILDAKDKCPNAAEDKDGFQDQDGCPDYDNDGDKIPDSLDKCPNETEDSDTVHNADGCPNYDNDGDKIPDSLDKCPNQIEDMDGFEDQDGCPDFDNDHDSIPDSLDKCPAQAEDKDGFDDVDGCPDFDNDHDSIPDSLDSCPNAAEVYNWVNDTDGCPDTLNLPSAAVQAQILKNIETIAAAKTVNKSKAAVATLSTTLKSLAPIRFAYGPVITAPGDSSSRAARLQKAAEIRNAVIENGVADSMITAIASDLLPSSSPDLLVIKTGGKEPMYCAIIAGKEVWAALQQTQITPLKKE